MSTKPDTGRDLPVAAEVARSTIKNAIRRKVLPVLPDDAYEEAVFGLTTRFSYADTSAGIDAAEEYLAELQNKYGCPRHA